jgi:hypothetical protein
MFSVITKKDYWAALKTGVTKPRAGSLKDIQDAYILHRLKDVKGAHILELGGGKSRVLTTLARKNECWNIDRFEGLGAGPTEMQDIPGVKVVKEYMGNYSEEIPSDYFDYVVSISVIEHIPSSSFSDVIKDCMRVLKVNGCMYHAVDIYLLDDISAHSHGANQRARLALYMSVPQLVEGKLQWIEPPEVDETLTANSRFASNNVDELYHWNNVVPSLESLREIAMSCSLKFGLRKVAYD